MTMAAMTLADHHAGLDQEPGEQARCAVPVVIIRAPLGRDRQQWLERLRAIQRLCLAIFIAANHYCILRRAHVQASNITRFFDKAWICRELECFGTVLDELAPPLEHGLLTQIDLGPDGGVGQALIIQKHDPATAGQSALRARPPNQGPQLVVLDIGQIKGRTRAHRWTPEYPGVATHRHRMWLRCS